jgi:hypothetical protein
MADPIYENVIRGTERQYQMYFERILASIDVENFTNQALGRPHDKKRIDGDYAIVKKLVNHAAEREHLLPVILQTMLEQYFWADIYMREMDKKRWIYRVMDRKGVDYFPDSMAVYNKMFDNGS